MLPLMRRMSYCALVLLCVSAVTLTACSRSKQAMGNAAVSRMLAKAAKLRQEAMQYMMKASQARAGAKTEVDVGKAKELIADIDQLSAQLRARQGSATGPMAENIRGGLETLKGAKEILARSLSELGAMAR